MPKGLSTILLFLIPAISPAQFYIRGDVRDTKNDYLQNVKIYRPSTQSLYRSGIEGGFGIPSAFADDSLIFTKEGFDTVRIRFKTSNYLHIIMKEDLRKKEPIIQKVNSITTGAESDASSISVYNGETYTRLVENPFIKTTRESKTTFGLRIDKASYSNVRRFISQQVQAPPDAVRLDEMLNYFDINYKKPDSLKTFGLESLITGCPWNADHRLMIMNISARELDLSKVPPSNFVFLIDVSGSMDFPNRLPLLKEAFQLFVKNLRSRDTVSIVTYGGQVGIWLPPTSGDKKEKILESIEELHASGDTPGEAAIKTAYHLANNTFIKGGNNRIILATDGDFNIGQNTEKELEELIEKEKMSGVYLTCLGVGMGNYKDSKIEILARKGNGNFAYIDDIHEAEKVMILQFTQTMYAVANDVYVDVKFDSSVVSQYRLLGYDNNKTDLSNIIGVPEGGEIGPGAENTVIFELKTNKPDSQILNRYYGSVAIHFTNPDDTTKQIQNFETRYNYRPFEHTKQSLRFATAVVMMGLKIRNSEYFPDVSWDTIYQIAASSVGNKSNYLENQFLSLIENCKKIYGSKHRKNK